MDSISFNPPFDCEMKSSVHLIFKRDRSQKSHFFQKLFETWVCYEKLRDCTINKYELSFV